MKKSISYVCAFVLGSTLIFSCKGDKKNETEASAAEETSTASTEAVKYKVNPSESTIEWVGSKPTGEHTGTLSIESGVLQASGAAVESGSFLINMKSITVTDLEGDEKASLEGHLKGMAEGKEDHFFNVEKYPTAAFEITGVSESGGKQMIDGNLTIRNTKKNISFPATFTQNGDSMLLTSEPFTINRTEWGVNYGSKSIFDNLGDKFIDDDIKLVVKVKASKA